MAELGQLQPKGEIIQVVNRLRTSVLGASAKQQVVQTLDRLGQISVDCFVPDEPAVADDAMRAGLPINLAKRSSKVKLAVELLVKNHLLNQRTELDERVAKLD